MRKRFSVFLAGVLVGAIIFGSAAMVFADNINVSFSPLTYYFDGVKKLPSNGQQGFIYNGSTYVPLRFISEALGCDVQWDGTNKSISISTGGNHSSNGYDTAPSSASTSSGPQYLTDVLSPYSMDGGLGGDASHYFEINQGETLGNDTYYKSIHPDCSSLLEWGITYNIDGKYDTLKLKAVSTNWNTNFRVIVDDSIVWQEPLKTNDLPKEITIDVSGASKLQFAGYGNWYVLDPTIE